MKESALLQGLSEIVEIMNLLAALREHPSQRIQDEAEKTLYALVKSLADEYGTL